jgi:hypothetical protein
MGGWYFVKVNTAKTPIKVTKQFEHLPKYLGLFGIVKT